MRTTLLTLCAMSTATLAVAVFFVQIAEAPARLHGPLIGKYAAGWRTAMVVEKRPAASSSPLANVTIINATRR